ncbi:MAG: DUF434 domain-containing protein [Myxococcales bacterium]|nr:DUF434 domain-containing protein [Myxococcales bacterium]MCB9578390.1 DUF434 domain-containing protein [Polyangiaceae bacterium]
MTSLSQGKLRRAIEDAGYLLSRGYPSRAVSELVADHLELSADERQALVALAAVRAKTTHHIARELEWEDIAKRPLRVDAESALGTVSAALTGAPLLSSPAGVVIDPNWRRGSALDERAFQLVADAVEAARPSVARFMIDASHPQADTLGGWVASRSSKKRPMELKKLGSVVERLHGAAQLVSSDPVLLDACVSWVNVIARAVRAAGGEPVALE